MVPQTTSKPQKVQDRDRYSCAALEGTKLPTHRPHRPLAPEVTCERSMSAM